MKAILITSQLYPVEPGHNKACTREDSLPETSSQRLPGLIDRPFLQHVAEAAIDAGAKEVEMVAGPGCGRIQELLGDGERWGARIRYHEYNAISGPWPWVLAIAAGCGEEPILVGRTDLLPQLDAEGLQQFEIPTFICENLDGSNWTGWALLRDEDLASARNVREAESFYREFASTGRARLAVHRTPKPLSMRSYSDLLDAHLRVLHNTHSGLLLTGREAAPGHWISRNAGIHRTARLIAPVYIGENSSIGAYCRIGPGAAIGRDCLIDRHTIIEDSVVCPGSYVGEGLELKQVFIDRSRFINTRLQVEIRDVDDLLLGSVYTPASRQTA